MSRQMISVDPRTVGFFNQVGDNKPLGWKLHCQLVSEFIDFEDSVAAGHFSPLAHCKDCDGHWNIKAGSPLWLNLLERVREERDAFKYLDEADQESYIFFDMYEMFPVTECPRCSNKFFGLHDQEARCEEDLVNLNHNLSQAQFKHASYHHGLGQTCSPDQCDLVAHEINPIRAALQNFDVKWAPLYNRSDDAAVLARQLIIN
jgi:hypothetical protein